MMITEKMTLKRVFCILSAAVLVLSAVSLASCGKKHVINADVDPAFDLATAGDAVQYVAVTDKNGEAVTDAEGETVTEAVSAQPQTEKETSEPERTTASGAGNNATEPASGQENTTVRIEPTTAAELSVKTGEYVLTLTADKTEVKAGDTLTLTYHLKNCRNVASIGLTVEADKKVSVTDYKSGKFFNADDERFDIYSNDTPEGVLFSGMITTTCDFLDDDLLTVTYLVGDQVKKGDKLTFRVVPTNFLVGDDSDGKHTTEYRAVLEKASVTVTVK